MHDRFPKQIISGALFIIVTQKAGRWRLYVKIWIHITVERMGHGKLCSSSLSCHLHVMAHPCVSLAHASHMSTTSHFKETGKCKLTTCIFWPNGEWWMGFFSICKITNISILSTSQFVLPSLQDYFLCLCQNPLPINDFPEHILSLIPYPQLGGGGLPIVKITVAIFLPLLLPYKQITLVQVNSTTLKWSYLRFYWFLHLRDNKRATLTN